MMQPRQPAKLPETAQIHAASISGADCETARALEISPECPVKKRHPNTKSCVHASNRVRDALKENFDLDGARAPRCCPSVRRRARRALQLPVVSRSLRRVAVSRFDIVVSRSVMGERTGGTADTRRRCRDDGSWHHFLDTRSGDR